MHVVDHSDHLSTCLGSQSVTNASVVHTWLLYTIRVASHSRYRLVMYAVRPLDHAQLSVRISGLTGPW